MNEREKEYLRIFIAESLEEYDEISKYVVSLENDAENADLLNEIFRLLHNMKANANAMGFMNLTDLAHQLENIFTSLRKGSFKFEGNVVEAVLEAVDLLGAIILSIEKPQQMPPPATEEKVKARLEAIIGGGGIESSQPQKRYFTAQNIALSDLVSIEVKKLDDLLNLVGELIIDRDRIYSISKKPGMEELISTSSHLYRITNLIQQKVMDARLVNIGTLLNKFPRIIRDISVTEGKKVNLEITGQDNRIDRNILQVITDSLLHIIRNAITHGIESTEERIKNGKPEEGRISISAESDNDIVIIRVADDGKGINTEKVREKAVAAGLISQEKMDQVKESDLLSMLFEPGFSLAGKITEVSGRGVGLDIVKSAIDSIGGSIRVSSKVGKGTTFRLSVPTSIAVKTALLFEVNRNVYAIPLIHIDLVIQLGPERIHQVGQLLMADVSGESIPLVYLNQFFSPDVIPLTKQNLSRAVNNMIIVNHNNKKLGLIVDAMLRQQEIVVKPLQRTLNVSEVFSGVTLLGTGEVCLVMDVPAVSKAYHKNKSNTNPEKYDNSAHVN